MSNKEIIELSVDAMNFLVSLLNHEFTYDKQQSWWVWMFDGHGWFFRNMSAGELLDFGLARISSDGTLQITELGKEYLRRYGVVPEIVYKQPLKPSSKLSDPEAQEALRAISRHTKPELRKFIGVA